MGCKAEGSFRTMVANHDLGVSATPKASKESMDHQVAGSPIE